MGFFNRFLTAFKAAKHDIDQRVADTDALVVLLSDPRYNFRKLTTLFAAVGHKPAAYVLELLDVIGTRREYRNNDLVGLVSRVGDSPKRREQLVSAIASPADKVLAALSDPRYKFRSLTALASAAGLSESGTRQLLNNIGGRVRTDHYNENLYGLVSRVGDGDGDARTPKQKIIAALSDPRFKFRSYEALVKAGGVSERETQNLLDGFDIRQERHNPCLYGLVSRVGASASQTVIAPVYEDEDEEFSGE